MIPPTKQWCIQIEVTNACIRKCSNCTRLLAHVKAPYFMEVDAFRADIEALKDFPKMSEPDHLGRRELGKVIGMMGGEPTLHPQFDRLCAIMREILPREHCGLWTSRPLGAREAMIRQTFGYLNYNLHEPPSFHQSALVAVQDAVQDSAEMWRLINQCWLQEAWSSSINPKGFFFCEVAAAFDLVFDGPGGLPVEPDCWRRPLSDFKAQIERWCPRCGICLYDKLSRKMAVPNIQNRPDFEEIDDVSLSNLDELRRVESPKIATRCYLHCNFKDATGEVERNTPWQYMRNRPHNNWKFMDDFRKKEE